eukprot:TRINITY_DN36832_c0_g1_i1.p1 TRINITY_DN36832_c0_g1~~TRINITY_DN36832_c0_g1_i1.p1  ORF type:complete len:433 (+),score=176.53 TRINITY_DN36832_c0_g1_i1:68-1300(+)
MAGHNSICSAALLTSFLANFCDYLLMTSIIPLFPILGYSEVATGLLFSCKAIVQIIAAPFFAKVIDSNPVRLLLLGLTVDIVATLAFAYHVNYTTWFVARSVQGLASAAILPASNALMQRYYKGEEQTRVAAFGISTSGILAGVVLGPPVGGVLFEMHPTLPFLATSLLLVASSVSALYVLSTTDFGVIEDEQHDPRDSMWKIKTFLNDKYIRTSMGALFIANAAISALEATFGVFGLKELNLTLGEVGLMYLWTTIPSILASALAGPFLHGTLFFEKYQVISAGLVLQGAFFMLGPKTVPMLNEVSFIGVGIGMGLIDGMCPSLNAQLADARHKGSTAVHSLSTMCIQGGFIAGPLLGSFLADTIGFWGMGIVLGGAMVLYAPSMTLLSEDWGNPDVDNDGEAQKLVPQ